MKKFKRGQSTLEYVIILAAVVGAIIVVASALKTKIPVSYNTLIDKMDAKVGLVHF